MAALRAGDGQGEAGINTNITTGARSLQVTDSDGAFLCLYGIDLGASTVRFQSELSISSDLDQ